MFRVAFLAAAIMATATTMGAVGQPFPQLFDQQPGSAAQLIRRNFTAESNGPQLQFLLFLQEVGAVYNVTAVEALMQRAVHAGYTQVVLYDHNLGAIESPRLNRGYRDSLLKVLALAQSVGLEVIPEIYSYGHSDGIVFQDASMVEAAPASAEFVVAPSGRWLTRNSSAGGSALSLRNQNFALHSGDRLEGWDVQDGPGVRTFFDGSLSHKSGEDGGSVRMEASADPEGRYANARIGQYAPR